MSDQTWITMHAGREISGHGTTSGLDQFIRRWNKDHPDKLVYRRPRLVEAKSLRAAIKAQSILSTPGLRVRKAISHQITKTRRNRATGPGARPTRKEDSAR